MSGGYFDEKAADTAVQFIETYCRHISGRWANPLDSSGRRQDTRIRLADWQKNEIIRPLFGQKKADGSRQYTTLYVEIPKKNGKSALSACIMLLFLYLDREPGSELYIACPVSKEQAASLLLEPARAMIEKDDLLKSKARIMGTRNYTKSILVGDAYLKPLTREAAASEGIKPQAAFIDETHVFKDAGVIENLEKSMIIRQQPLVCYTTTAGDSMAGVGYEKSQYFKKVKAGMIDDPSALVCIYGADAEDDPFDEKTWEAANPMWNISINKEQFRKEAAKAKESAASLNSFKRYHLNIWTQSTEAYIADHVWQQSVWQVDAGELRGLPAIAAFDLGVTSDLTALTLHVWQGDRVVSFNWFWLPAEQGHGNIKEKVHLYPQWVRDGHIMEIPGTVRDDDTIVDAIMDVLAGWNVVGLAYDPYQATNIASKIIKGGFDQVYSVRTGVKTLAEPTRILMDMVNSGKFNHQNNPVLRWMNSNVEIIVDNNGNMMPFRGKRQHKIDGILSNLYALTLYLELEKKGEVGSYMDSSDMMVI